MRDDTNLLVRHNAENYPKLARSTALADSAPWQLQTRLENVWINVKYSTVIMKKLFHWHLSSLQTERAKKKRIKKTLMIGHSIAGVPVEAAAKAAFVYNYSRGLLVNTMEIDDHTTGICIWLGFDNGIVICLHFQSTKWALWLVDSWSRAHDQIQTCPDRDAIAQLFQVTLNTRACDKCMTELKMAWSSARAHVSGNIRILGKTKLTVSLGKPKWPISLVYMSKLLITKITAFNNERFLNPKNFTRSNVSSLLGCINQIGIHF